MKKVSFTLNHSEKSIDKDESNNYSNKDTVYSSLVVIYINNA